MQIVVKVRFILCPQRCHPGARRGPDILLILTANARRKAPSMPINIQYLTHPITPIHIPR